MDLIVLAIPFFFLLMGLEYLIARKTQRKIYKADDFCSNINCGILEQLVTLPLKGLLIWAYQFLYQYHALINISGQSVLAWILLWLGIDFLYYWYHRAAHRISLLWAGHAVHHQSEYFNLSVALRQGILQTLTSWVFYLPLALIGFPTWMFLLMSTLNTLYQFWIHTSLIEDLGWFESIFNTPAHHRVHHGKNQAYLDKNFAGSLIIWDKLFGSFAKKDEPIEYGTTEPLRSNNPFYANIKVLVDLWHYTAPMQSVGKRLLSYLRPPEWILTYYQQQGLHFKSRTSAPMPDSPYPWLNIANTFLLSLLLACLLIYHLPAWPAIAIATWMMGLIIFFGRRKRV